jgi:ERF superfamily
VTHTSLAEALAAFQGEVVDPHRSKKGQVRGKADYVYVPLDDLLAAVRPLMCKHGLAVTQPVAVVGERVGVRTTLLHASGQQIEGFYPVPWGGGAQERGSEITYARRYSLEAILGIAPTDDDDGKAAQEGRAAQDGKSKPKTEAKTEPKPAPAKGAKKESGPADSVVAALTAAGWAADVVEGIRDFSAWMGVTTDPWAADAQRQAKLPEWVAGKQADVDAWKAWGAEYTTTLRELELSAGEVDAWCVANKRKPAGRLAAKDRPKLVAYLRDAGGADKVRELRTVEGA